MNKTFTTAKGIAYYPYISAPDTKFDEQGHYKVNLCLSEEDAQPVIEVIKQTVVEGIKALKKEKPNMEIKQAPLPFSKEVDEDGNPTLMSGPEDAIKKNCQNYLLLIPEKIIS